MNRKSFTLIEIIFCVIILGILVTVGYPSYQNIIEDSHRKVCKANLKALGIAFEAAVKEGASPTTLGELRKDSLEKAYAAVLKEEGLWQMRAALFISTVTQSRVAYALPDFVRGNSRILTCPKALAGEVSYCLNSIFTSGPVTFAQYRALSAREAIIGDCNLSTQEFSNWDNESLKRHRKYNVFGRIAYAQGYLKAQVVGTITHDLLPGSCTCYDNCSTSNHTMAQCLQYCERYCSADPSTWQKCAAKCIYFGCSDSGG